MPKNTECLRQEDYGDLAQVMAVEYHEASITDRLVAKATYELVLRLANSLQKADGSFDKQAFLERILK